jgi:hypothetical protein
MIADFLTDSENPGSIGIALCREKGTYADILRRGAKKEPLFLGGVF